MEKQREIDGRSMKSIIEQSFGNIECSDVPFIVVIATIFRTKAIEHELVLVIEIDKLGVMLQHSYRSECFYLCLRG